MHSCHVRTLGMRTAIVVAFVVMLLAGLFLHAMLVPWMPLWSGGLYDFVLWQQPVEVWGPSIAAVDGVLFLLLFGWVTCASVCGTIWSSFLVALQDDGVGCCRIKPCMPTRRLVVTDRDRLEPDSSQVKSGARLMPSGDADGSVALGPH